MRYAVFLVDKFFFFIFFRYLIRHKISVRGEPIVELRFTFPNHGAESHHKYEVGSLDRVIPG